MAKKKGKRPNPPKKPLKRRDKKPEKKRKKSPAKKKPAKKPSKKKPVKPGFVIPEGAVHGGGARPIRTPDAMKENINLVLLAAKRKITSEEATAKLEIKQPLDVDVKTYKNLSDSIDGQLIIRKVPRGVSIHDVLIDIAAAFRTVPESFITVGLRYSGADGVKGSEDYRNKGMSIVHTNYKRSSREYNIETAFGYAREINKRLHEATGKKPQEIFVRYHWNKTGTRPIRKNAPKDKKRRR